MWNLISLLWREHSPFLSKKNRKQSWKRLKIKANAFYFNIIFIFQKNQCKFVKENQKRTLSKIFFLESQLKNSFLETISLFSYIFRKLYVKFNFSLVKKLHSSPFKKKSKAELQKTRN